MTYTLKDIMKDMRKVDNNIILKTQFHQTQIEKCACADFFKQLAEAYKKREDAVNYCLQVKLFLSSCSTRAKTLLAGPRRRNWKEI